MKIGRFEVFRDRFRSPLQCEVYRDRFGVVGWIGPFTFFWWR